MRRSLLVLGALSVAALAACSEEIDAGKVEDTIRDEVQGVWGQLGEIGDVSCPEGIEPEAGSTFTCESQVAGQPVTLEVTQQDDDGNLTFENVEAVLDVAALEQEIATGLAEQVEVEAEVDCGEGAVRVEAPGSTFACQAAGGGETAEIAVTVTDNQGNVEWELA